MGERKVTLVPRPACLQALSMDALQLVATDHAVFNSSQKAAGRQVRRGGGGGQLMPPEGGRQAGEAGGGGR